MSEDRLQEILDMQEDLNDFIFRKKNMFVNGSNQETLEVSDIRHSQDLGPSGLKNEWLRKYSKALENENLELMDELLWKWWSSDKINLQHIKVELIDMLHFLMSMFLCVGMNSEDIYKIYEQKWKVNFDRQENGYNRENKTEEDNESINTEFSDK